jgi:hypothetical protein
VSVPSVKLNWNPPVFSPVSECVSPLGPKGAEEQHSLAGVGVGGPNSDDWRGTGARSQDGSWGRDGILRERVMGRKGLKHSKKSETNAKGASRLKKNTKNHDFDRVSAELKLEGKRKEEREYLCWNF